LWFYGSKTTDWRHATMPTKRAKETRENESGPIAGATPAEPESPERIAFHEAGHAVMSLLFGRAVRCVTILPDQARGSLGHVQPAGRKLPDAACYLIDRKGVLLSQAEIEAADFGDLQPNIYVNARAHQLVDQEVLMILGGPVAEAQKCRPGFPRELLPAEVWYRLGEPDREGIASDLVVIRRLARMVCGSECAREAYIAFMIEQAMDLLTMPPFWRAVEAMAAALLDRRTLNGDEARVIFMEAIGEMMFPETPREQLRDFQLDRFGSFREIVRRKRSAS
jgi:hypothetical protein